MDPDSTSVQIRKAVAGETDSLGWLIERFTPILLGQATHRLGGELRNLYDPEDLVNDVWAIALPKLADLPDADEGLTPMVVKFLSQILVYRLNNLVRKHITGKPARDADGEARLDRLAPETLGVVTRVVREEKYKSVANALAALDPADRELVVLRGIEQHSVKKIAVLLQLSENTVSVRYRRALQKLKQRLPGTIFDELT